jgi:iron uptake system component EfeO
MALVGLTGILAACSSDDDNGSPTTDAGTTDGGVVTSGDGGSTPLSAQIAANMASTMASTLADLVTSAQAMQAAAPSTAWTYQTGASTDLTDDQFNAMATPWAKARADYEMVEGATAPIYPNIDTTIDGRVEDFGPSGAMPTLTSSSDMFGTSGMSGLHAAERILFIWSTPAAVATYETGLGYCPPQAYPTTDAQALEFKNVLLQQIITDAQTLQQGWTASNIDIGGAFNGLIGLMNEQHEKTSLAGLHEEESRYSQHTMTDLRDNLQGTQNIYKLFQPWLTSVAGGAAIDTQITAGFGTLSTLYASSAYAGQAFPQPPSDWSENDPTSADLATPFGQLYEAVVTATDATQSGSVVFEMNAAATLLGLPPFEG